MTSVSTILVATDFSRTSQFALDYAMGHAKLAGAKLLIVHVFEVPSLDKGEGLMHHGLGTGDSEAAERRLRAIKPEAAELQFEHHFVRGEPAAEILRLAQEERADLIVMGTHGRTGLMRALIGSVAERVLRASTCPVVSIKLPEALS